MSAEKFLFYIFSVLIIFSATMVITVRNPVKASLFLVLTFFFSAVIWLLLEAEFLAIALVLVYVGAVMVLFLFVVMMLDVNLERLKAGFIRYLPVGIAVALIMVTFIISVVGGGAFSLAKIAEPARHLADYSNTKEIGSVLYTVYVYPFEIAAVILLVAIVAAIALTLRHRPETKYQNPVRQIGVTKSERIRIIQMPTEKKK